MFEKSKSTTERAINFVRAHPAPEEGVVGAFKLVMPEAQRKACSGIKGMVKIFYQIPDNPASDPDAPDAAPKPAGKRKRGESMHSSDLWDLPGGATGDEC